MIKEQMTSGASLENIPQFRDFAEQSCVRAGLRQDLCFGLKLAVDEVCTNIVEHGYGPGTEGEISLLIEIDDRQARITVIDQGRPFSPDQAPAPAVDARWDERPIGGLGWHLVRSVVDEIRYRRDGADNRLTLVKTLDGGAGSSPGQE